MVSGLVRKRLCLLVSLAAMAAGTAFGQDEGALTRQYTAAREARNWPLAESLARQLVALHPQGWRGLRALAEAQTGAGDYADALASFQSAILSAKFMSDSEARVAPGEMLVEEGNVYLKLHRNQEALAAFNAAAALSDNPKTAYFNICAVEYNALDVFGVAGVVTACDRAIKADPAKADAWFIKGSALIGQATLGPNGKLVAPKGAVEALGEYLTLAPAGGHAEDARQMLQMLR